MHCNKTIQLVIYFLSMRKLIFTLIFKFILSFKHNQYLKYLIEKAPITSHMKGGII